MFYPFVESIKSALPLVDEFVVAVGRGDVGDTTRRDIEAIGSEKIRIIDTVWDTQTYRGGTEYARQTMIAKAACTGDWLLYLQADEVLHEEDLPRIHKACAEHLSNERIEGMICSYLHFWGDYQHYHRSHGWYPFEVRIVRNRPDIYSWVDAQSFRRIPSFTGNYAQHDDTYKLRVVNSAARIFHYGWVRPPDFMQRKKQQMEQQYHGSSAASAEMFQYGNLRDIPLYTGTHPAVMSERIAAMDWQDQLDAHAHDALTRPLFKHERTKYKLITWIEQTLLRGRQLGSFKNYELHR